MRVLCIDDDQCGNHIVAGKVYDVVASSSDSAGHKYYSLANIRSEWYQYRFIRI